MKLQSEEAVQTKFDSYPEEAKEAMEELRELVTDTANNMDGLDELHETLKWGEPSYVAKYGSTLRMDWKAKNPKNVALYFKCTSKLVPTIKTMFGDVFEYENNRAIYLKIGEPWPLKELNTCIKMALTYHKIKNLPLLGQ
jgi:hypothetical protein